MVYLVYLVHVVYLVRSKLENQTDWIDKTDQIDLSPFIG
jgi:hypothetical protein